MRRAVLILGIALGANSAMAAEYRAPVGNCDGATMMLEAARQAHLRASAAFSAVGGTCSPARTKALDTMLSSAAQLERRATEALAACPGMDDMMWQGREMQSFARREISGAEKSRATCAP